MSVEDKLDIAEFLERFRSFFARPKPLAIEGDASLHYAYMVELSKHTFKNPPKVPNLDTALMHIQKQGVLRLEEIFAFVKIIRYFRYLQSLGWEGKVGEWIESIEIPNEIVEICDYFDDEGAIKSGVEERLDELVAMLENNKRRIKERMQAIINARKMQSYLVDRQIHYINGEEALLVRGGFNHVLKATVIGRSSAGYFYVVPEELAKLKEKEAEILSQIEEIRYAIAKRISTLFGKWLKFLRYIDKQFDRFDHYQARIAFAKAIDGHIILPKNDRAIILKNFRHPAIENPKPVSIDFSKKVLLITGVNAGGKTMLLKSILAAAYLAKNLVPMQCDPDSRIGRFKEIIPIIEDPQNVKNDISTFAGRMLAFSRLFQKSGVLVGVDEIELGTDSDEAATLFKVIIEELMQRDVKIAITTHHKRLAALLAAHEDVELVAAMYDEERGVPTYEFLQGIIGKSYAFETAKRYGIPAHIVARAVREYGEDQAKLSELIERGSALERELRAKNEALAQELEAVRKKRALLEAERAREYEELLAKKRELEAIYNEAIQEAKAAIKAKETKEAHRHLTSAATKAKRAKISPPKPPQLQVGDAVRYGKTKGTIIAIKGKEATIEADGIKLRVPLSQLRPTTLAKPKQKVQAKVSKPSQLGVKLDLHGQRVDEALENVDKFLSDALLAGLDEVLIFHGVGTGRLARAVREFLAKHPRVKSYHDAPPQMGGMGATVVEL